MLASSLLPLCGLRRGWRHLSDVGPGRALYACAYLLNMGHAKSLHRLNSGIVSTVPPTGQLSARFVILYYLQPLFLFLSGCPPGSVSLYNLYPSFLALPRYPPRSVSLCYQYPLLLR
jgi:hypothetical protein